MKIKTYQAQLLRSGPHMGAENVQVVPLSDLAALLEEAYREGHVVGYCDGECSIDDECKDVRIHWQESNTKAALDAAVKKAAGGGE